MHLLCHDEDIVGLVDQAKVDMEPGDSVGVGKLLMDSCIFSGGMRLAGEIWNPAKSIVSWQN